MKCIKKVATPVLAKMSRAKFAININLQEFLSIFIFFCVKIHKYFRKMGGDFLSSTPGEIVALFA